MALQKKIEVVDASRISVTTTTTTTSTKSTDKTTAKTSDESAITTTTTTTTTSSSALPRQLVQYEMKVPTEDKDIYLYAFLTQHLLQPKGELSSPTSVDKQPLGRVVIFVNAIKTCRRVDGLLRAMGFACRPLHAELTQRNRLQNLEFLKNQSKSILVATDVAARGLDVQNISAVVHYDVARSPQVYIHRSGRTARNGQSGTAISLISPDDLAHHNQITQYLHQSGSLSNSNNASNANPPGNANPNQAQKKRYSFATLPVQMSLLPALRDRVLLARKIFSLSAQQSRDSKEHHWSLQQAQEADLEPLEEDLPMAAQDQPSAVDEEILQAQQRLTAKQKKTLAALRKQLTTLLETPMTGSHQPMNVQNVLTAPSSGLALSTNQLAPSRKHGKKARKDQPGKGSMAMKQQMQQQDWKKRKSGFFVYAK